MNPRLTPPEGLDQLKEFGDLKDLEIHLGDQSVAGYASEEPIPDGFPRPADHFIIADFLIDLPVLAADFATDHGTHGRVIGYSYGEHWVVASSVSELIERLKASGTDAVWGPPNQAQVQERSATGETK
jgi:hypothetical protein